ncbi:hypothetical protein GCM10027598_28170 [Amycolatopsis oliviviridis]|uniref:Secreted protein n=1 Tax=Amycolatopsis oliviviridis TaxID=1471590 RepID=A0ABQ3LJW1_9PSEU|nr:hypothetical protein [Amycolatopsis oliviviridis]GHH18084.1 hypothetical protein GCM10017790_35820 [Amycolatopsis oliviviridis]
MTIKNVLAGSVVLCAGLTFAGADEASAARPCASGVKTIKPVVLEDPGRWTYTYDLAWCADGGTVVWVEPSVTPRVHVPACNWVGRIEESLRKPVREGDPWTAFDMSEFSCADNAGKEHGVNPWVVVSFAPSGAYTVTSGIDPA